MINTTIAYKRAIEKNRQFRLLDKIILNDGKELPLSMEDVTAYSINEATSANGKFEIGAAIVKEYKASLNNMDGNLDGIGFEGADISAKIGLRLQDGSWEDLRKGEFRIVEAKEKDLTIDIKAYDGMLFFDRPYSESKLSYPASINQIISDACLSCQMMFNARTVQMRNYIVKNRPDDKAVTFRDIISYCAQIMGCYAYINNLGQLEFGWYDFNELKFLRDGRYDGGMFDKSTPYASGDILDGGGFAPWSAGDVLDGGEFTDMESYHHVYLLKSKSVNTNDITITGVSISFKKDDDQEEVLMYGEEGYVLELSENPLIQDDAQQILQHVGQKVTGNTFRPLSITTQSDPSMEAGDLVIVTDRKQRSYWTVITNTTFSLSGSQKIECSAETPTEKNYTRYGAVTKLVSAAKENSERKLSSYENTSRQFSELMARSMGLYTTYEEQEDGSIIKYQHDKPQLSESKTIWKQSQNAFGVSTDGGKTWNAGTDAEGNALYNVLSVIGFYFDWAKGGTITLGGEDNVDGELVVYDSAGNERSRINATEGVVLFGKTMTGWYRAGLRPAECYTRTAKTTKLGLLCEFYSPSGGGNVLEGSIAICPPGSDLLTGSISEPSYDTHLVSSGPGGLVVEHGNGYSTFSPQYLIQLGETKNKIFLGIERVWTNNETIHSGIRIEQENDDRGEVLLENARLNIGMQGIIKGSLYHYTSNTPNLWWTASSTNVGFMSVCASSSRRYKEIKRKMDENDALRFYNIQPVIASYKNGYLSSEDRRSGVSYPMFIAEDIEKYFPEAVDYNDKNEVEDWNFRIMIPAMFQMIKSQKEIIDSQSEKIDNLTERIERLEALLLKGDD